MEKLFSKQDLVASVAETADLSKVKASEAVGAVLSAIESALHKKQEVRLVGFGSFIITERKATKGRNPRTKEEIDIPALTSVRFKPGKALKDTLNPKHENAHHEKVKAPVAGGGARSKKSKKA